MDDVREEIRQKAAVIGIDGATFDLLGPMLDAGHMPNLKRLMAEGASGVLTTTIPPVSASAWVSMATGTNPGQHGMIDFTYPREDGYDIEVSNGLSWQAPPLWYYVGRAGGKSGIISLPMVYPPRPIHGYMLATFLAPSEEANYTYPPGLKGEIEEAVGHFPVQMDESARGRDRAIFVQAVTEMELQRSRVVSYLLDTKPWDFFVYVMETTDNLQHEIWHIIDPNHPRHDPAEAERVLPAIENYYRTVDEQIGVMLARIPRDALVIVMSDHGFGPFHRFFHVNNWLMQEGYLAIKRNLLSQTKLLLHKLGFTPLNVLRLLTAVGLARLRKQVKRGRSQGLLRKAFLSFRDVDWKRTKAFAVGNFGQVYLNVRGRRPYGTVEPGEDYDATCQALIEAALALRDPDDGAQVVKYAYRREEVFQGEAASRTPDIVLHTDRARYVSFGHADFGSNKVIEDSFGQTGHHHMEGVIILGGPGVRQNAKLSGARITDVAPTILWAMGLPVPRYMDGQVLSDAFEPEIVAECPVTFSYDSPSVNLADMDESAFSPGEEDLVIDRLRDLGYIA
jgi:predicted AlkP superfamily phosphohydrolase/phosphomutase